MPERFDLTYEKDDKKHRPVIIHRTIYGSLERFIGILLENFSGKLPLWLNPNQIKIVTITERNKDFANKVFEKLKEWKQKHKESFLCSYIFIELPQFDFYNKGDTITSFIMGDDIEMMEDEKFLKSKEKLKELKLDDIKVNQEKALDFIKEKKEYHKRIIILQKTKEPFWNITLISASKLLNIKINAVNEKILSKTIEPISKLMRKVA